MIRDVLSQPRPTTGAFFTKLQREHERKQRQPPDSVVTTTDMTADEKDARRDIVVTQEHIRRTNREFRQRESAAVAEKKMTQDELSAVMGGARAIRIELPVPHTDGQVADVYIVRSRRKVIKAMALGRVEAFAAMCPATEHQSELRPVFEQVYADIEQSEAATKHTRRPKHTTHFDTIAQELGRT